jgi:hypothetical protein
MVLDPIKELDVEEGLESFDSDASLPLQQELPLTRKKFCCCSLLIGFLMTLIVIIIALLFYGIWRIVVQLKA